MLADRGADAAILDIRMAGMNGIELLQRVKELDPDMEIIMLTAYASMETARQAIRLGAFDYLNKPFEVKTLRQAVTAAMARRSLSQEVRHNEERLATLQSELQNQQLLQEIARTRGEIYASVIHDMKQPLTVISGYIQLAMSGLDEASQNGTSDLSEVKSLLRLMTRQVTNCVDISQRYLSFLRRQPLGGSTVQAAQIFADLTDLIRGHPSVRGQTLRISPLPVDMALKTNGTDVLQILLNLIINACQCSPLPHHVDVRGEALHNPLDLDSIASSPGEYVLNREGFKNGPPFFAILVEDDGPGIPPELLGKIFEAYFTTKSSSQGTGLGLAIVLRLVREAGGLIVVRSTLGKGTTFKIVLPAANLPSNRNE
jgi:signal transduction histidine kinase